MAEQSSHLSRSMAVIYDQLHAVSVLHQKPFPKAQLAFMSLLDEHLTVLLKRDTVGSAKILVRMGVRGARISTVEMGRCLGLEGSRAPAARLWPKLTLRILAGLGGEAGGRTVATPV